MSHKPVLLKETLDCLGLKPGQTVIDGTLGSAGHASKILEVIGEKGRFIGLDQDPEAIDRCRRILSRWRHVSLHCENFKNLVQVLDDLNISQVDAVIFDVGVSTEQLEDPIRGFSFDRTGPLDMRMNPEMPKSARDLVNDLSKDALEQIFWGYGNERWARRFAEAICRQRRRSRIETTDDLVRTLLEALPFRTARKVRRPGWARRHPATRVFQALRIAVNDELGALEAALPGIWDRLKPGGRLAVISYHSLEDRIVKVQFRSWCADGRARPITKKPIVPTPSERRLNPRSRSAKLRVVEKIK
ncbi:MAG: 16S rRNA (cytosine(1402)-N(4))-methyltransferase RsmH [Candidatus Omnitrophica bacterium]|nr:16S rRNA (cytosine(1402)-N(4))-methyltransferase RsmH [Candidatus Omnitrophota bacterium]